MSTEFHLVFPDAIWYMKNKAALIQQCSALPTFAGVAGFDKVLFKATRPNGSSWHFDVRLIFGATSILLEVTAPGENVWRDLSSFLRNVPSHLRPMIVDEDGELADLSL